jgi:hypothetical protein
VREKPSPFLGTGSKLAAIEDDVACERKRARLELSAQFDRAAPYMNTHVLECMTEPRFEETARGRGQRLSAAAQVVDARGRRWGHATSGLLSGGFGLNLFFLLFHRLPLHFFFAFGTHPLDGRRVIVPGGDG